MSAKPGAEELARQAKFIFIGTVKKLQAATLPEIKDKSRTVIVRVDEVIQAPQTQQKYHGQDITVQLTGRKKVEVGQQAVFYTNGWIYGDSIAVQSIGHHKVEQTPASLRLPGDPVKRLEERELQERLASADLVISGKVSGVRLPPTNLLAAEQPPSGRISEHDPEWREALIDIAAVHKGRHSQKQIVVMFPSSTDVMWYKAPKFSPGQEGIFLLHPSRITSTGAAPAAAPETVGVPAHTSLHPLDFQPLDQQHADAIRMLVEPLAGSEKRPGKSRSRKKR
jgi:hypothetical protein